ncbi:hypothetical protein SUBVAR_06643 [Subdoligranulum variabile DSM 15176]|uniref:Uncharacterized protein n=1 Tax=Subdoligranulum variabile DSM 15176 TaxID=411471 RepID=D1PQH4_9FIRM|nr:hypothetical protein SUBVAR_06643 [Subdoligranulum variabile DSM 15176]
MGTIKGDSIRMDCCCPFSVPAASDAAAGRRYYRERTRTL